MPATEIVPGLFVGGIDDAQTFIGRIISVTDERLANEPPQAIHIAILRPIGRGGEMRTTATILDEVAAAIREARHTGDPLLVHCGAGLERAPLAVAWYLHRQRGISLTEAYRVVAEKRPAIFEREHWIMDRDGWEGR